MGKSASLFQRGILGIPFLRKGKVAVNNKDISSKNPFDEFSVLLDGIRNSTMNMQIEYDGSSATIGHRVAKLSDTLSVLYPTMVSLHRSYVEQSQRNEILERETHQASSKLRVAVEELAHHKQRTAECERQLDASANENSALHQRVDSLENDLSKLGQARQKLEFELSTERRKAAALEENSRILQVRLRKRESELLVAKGEGSRLANDLTEAKLSAEVKQKNLTRLTELFSEEQAGRAKTEVLLVQANNDLQAVRHALRQREKELEAARARYEMQVERVTADSNEARLAVEALQSRITVLEKILRSQRAKLENSSAHVAYLQSTMRGLLAGRTDIQEVDLSFGFDDGEEPGSEVEEDAEPASGQRDSLSDAEDAGALRGEDNRVVQLMAGGQKG